MKELVSSLGLDYFIAKKYDVYYLTRTQTRMCTLPLVIGIFLDEYDSENDLWHYWLE